MIKSILVVLDGQDADHPSIDLALRWAADFDALFVALGVLDDTIVNPPEAVPLGAGEAKRALDAARLREQRLAVERSLSAVAARCAGEQVAFKPLESVGLTLEQINLESQRFDVIIMQRPLPNGDGSAEADSADVLKSILHQTPRPVVAVPPHASVGETIVVAYDGSLQAARALQVFAATGLAAKFPVHVVTVHDDPVEAARLGSRATDFLTYHKIPAKLHPVPRTATVSEHLIDLAQQLDAGLLVMGAYGRPRICEFFLGSVTRLVLADCSIPLFLYH